MLCQVGPSVVRAAPFLFLSSKPWEVLPVETGAWLCVLLLFIVLVILTFMAHVLDVNSFLQRHCGQNHSRVQSQALL